MEKRGVKTGEHGDFGGRAPKTATNIGNFQKGQGARPTKKRSPLRGAWGEREAKWVDMSAVPDQRVCFLPPSARTRRAPYKKALSPPQCVGRA